MANFDALEDVIAHRDAHADFHGGLTYWLLELSDVGGDIITYTAFEPDPNTHRGDFYYNAATNVLYKKVATCGGLFDWKQISTG